jgi:hypothetical protein
LPCGDYPAVWARSHPPLGSVDGQSSAPEPARCSLPRDGWRPIPC